MAFRGRGRGTSANTTGANNRGSGGFSARGRAGFGRDNGPPSEIIEMGSFLHSCEGELVCESVNVKIPYFNAPIFLQNKTSIGKVDEILGPITSLYFTIKPSEGIQASSFKAGDKFYIGGDRLLPLEKFLPKPKPPPGAPKPKRAGAKGGRGAPMKGGRGGGRGSARGRGGFSSRGSSGRGASNFSRSGSGFTPRGRGTGRGGYSSQGRS
ncbi:H/ACA ribonucleoprotein complex subunit GAR1 [Erysiphe necator]|uniref:H/ACA ribonucleoprotein complex subunit n=1 Tax=Uncinula necator TaxID=52586 RepID=A0A0B1PBE6_UNCNE|nr:H/ACA ribonucleoprotein complex subunit GAR1 [Erysiphe necator]KHJ33979.1 putative h aca ribonucleoprotein complex subunit 1 [Erysiphe necator]